MPGYFEQGFSGPGGGGGLGLVMIQARHLKPRNQKEAPKPEPHELNVGALITRTGFGGILH